MMGVKSGTTEPGILVCNYYHLFTYAFSCSYVGQDLGRVIQSMPRLVQGLSNWLMFIFTFEKDLNFSVIQEPNLFYWKY